MAGASSSSSLPGIPRLPSRECQMEGRRGLCRGCLSAAKWVPVVFIAAIVGWSYYAYVIQLCLLTVESNVERVALMVAYHLFFTMFVWSYWRTIFTAPGYVPQKFRLTVEEMDAIENSDNHRGALEQVVVRKDLPCVMRSLHQEIRYCSECSLVKPDRAHHCSVCGRCILKMDHHCPWVNNCVAFNNYKFFVLFLGYALLYCFYVCLSTLQYFLQFWSSVSVDGAKFHVLFLFFVGAMFSISLASLFFYHLFLVSKNMTTLEAFRAPITRNGPDKMAFHLGRCNNFQEIFGDNKALWFLPVFSSFGDGVVFPQRGQLDEEAGLLDGHSPTNASGGGLGGYASEEHVPMMLSVAAAGEEEDPAMRHANTSTSSEETAGAGVLSSNGFASTGVVAYTDDQDRDLVTVNM